MRTVESLLERYCAAARDRDVEAMLSLYASDFRLFDMMLPWQNQSPEAWRTSVQGWFEGSGDHPGAEAQQTEITTTDGMACLTTIMTYFYEGEEGERKFMHNRLTWVLMPFDGDWKIVHEHTSIPWNESAGKPEWVFPAE